MKVVFGDLVELALAGCFDVIVHGCNCRRTMGAGLARRVKEVFPEAYAADQRSLSSPYKLGAITKAVCPTPAGSVVVVNAYTQVEWRGDGVKTDNAAVRRVFTQVAAEFPRSRIAYPRIGSGLGGGNWAEIAPIIEETLQGLDHTLVEWTGP